MIECPYCGEKRLRGNSCRNCGRIDLDTLRSINISYKVNPSRMNSVPPRSSNNSFERGIRKDKRGLSYLDKNGRPLRMGELFNPRDYGDTTVKISTAKGKS